MRVRKVRVHVQGPPLLGVRFVEPPDVKVKVSKVASGTRVARVDLDGCPKLGNRLVMLAFEVEAHPFLEVFLRLAIHERFAVGSLKLLSPVDLTDPAIGADEEGIDGSQMLVLVERPFEVADRLPVFTNETPMLCRISGSSLSRAAFL